MDQAYYLLHRDEILQKRRTHYSANRAQILTERHDDYWKRRDEIRRQRQERVKTGPKWLASIPKEKTLELFLSYKDYPGNIDQFAENVSWDRIALSRLFERDVPEDYRQFVHLKRVNAATALHLKSDGRIRELLENPVKARELFDQYKSSRMRLAAFCEIADLSNKTLIKIFTKHFAGEYDAFVEEKTCELNSAYRVGYNFEYRVMDFLKKNGIDVIRRGRSKTPDLLAYRFRKAAYIECKSGGLFARKDIEKVEMHASKYGGLAIYARKNGLDLEFLKLMNGKLVTYDLVGFMLSN